MKVQQYALEKCGLPETKAKEIVDLFESETVKAGKYTLSSEGFVGYFDPEKKNSLVFYDYSKGREGWTIHGDKNKPPYVIAHENFIDMIENDKPALYARKFDAGQRQK